MKKIILLIIVLAFFSINANAGETKIAYVDFKRAVSESDQGKAALSDLEKLVDEKKSDIDAILPDGMRLFVDEVSSFCSNHTVDITAQIFFDKLLSDPDVQIPTVTTLANPALVDETELIAYESLKRAVEKTFG